MDESWRRIIEQQAAFKRMTDALNPEAIRMLKESQRQQQMISEMLRIAPEVSRFADIARERRDMLASITTVSQVAQAAEYAKLFRMPMADEIKRLTETLRITSRIADLTDASAAITASKAAMAQMHHPWLEIGNPAESVNAFVAVQAIGRALIERPPFDQALSTSLRASLGDWRDVELPQPLVALEDASQRLNLYWEQGLDPTLTDFPSPAFGDAVVSAGLSEPLSLSGEGSDDGFALARQAFSKLQNLEQELRRLVDREMRAVSGDKWMKQRLPPNMFEAWKEKQRTAVSKGEAELPLIDYADFSDYRIIIERADNWREVFSAIFVRKEDIRESLVRLQPVRIATMHARPITNEDWLLLLVETRRVLKAVKRVNAS